MVTNKDSFKKKPPPPPDNPQAKVERALIESFLAGKGYRLKDIHLLPKDLARSLMIEASIYASNKLAEMEIRSSLAEELHIDLH